jgi:ketosteroid isomerase-like protein
MDHDGVQRWLDQYVAAWASYDRDAIAALFSEDARYRYHPWDDWIESRAAIVDDWLSDRDEPESWSATYEPYAVDGDAVVAVGRSTYANPDGSIRKVYENCFLMRFDAEGQCSEFTEFFMERPATE